ncbi:CBS domain-containing protein [Paraglaciecola sp.]|uniref:CBS domain-containing protein n=1 Tax=Paraglaciecola sp. TaxID=1920173 RepID=UPI003EFA13A4
MTNNQNIKQIISTNLAQIPISEVMSKTILTVYEGWSIKRLSQFFRKHHISGAPVIAADEELVGVVTQSDIIKFESSDPDKQQIQKLIREYCGPFGQEADETEITRIQQRANEYCTVNSIMTKQVLSIDQESNLDLAYKLMVEKNIHRLFVTQRGLLIGVLTGMDILRMLQKS